MNRPIETLADLETFVAYDTGRPQVTLKCRNGCWYARIEALRAPWATVERGHAKPTEAVRLAVDDYRAQRAQVA